MPTTLSGVNYTIQESGIQGSNMYANVVCQCCSSWSGGSLDTTSTKQPWTWAIGPGKSGVSGTRRDSPRANVVIQQHADYGLFFMDMTAAPSTSTNIPTINGTTKAIGFTLAGSISGIIGACFVAVIIIIILIVANILKKRGKGRRQGNVVRTADSTMNDPHGIADDIPLAYYPSNGSRDRLQEEQEQSRFVWKPVVGHDPLRQT
ncbi:hypothetical protein MMC10_003427 [Thelotrema lepadinum]|nr:hypothetical protein [Thelotrema lepadinum]